MDYVNLGNTGLKVSRICLGCMTYGAPAAPEAAKGGRHAWALNEDQSQPFFRQALDLGINFFDTANVYSSGASEEVLGRFLKANVRRESVVIATKVHGVMRDEPNGHGLSRREIFFELDQSLRRLGTDYIDLYQIHRWDDETPIEETLEALHDVVKAGKVRYIGASSMYSWQFAKALYLADLNGWTRFVSMQNHYNLLYREEEREMIPLCRAEGIGIVPWSPLARGRLARPWQSETTKRSETDRFGNTMYARTEEADHKVVDRLAELAKRRNVSQATLALAWMLTKPGITAPIVGATKQRHLEDAAAALPVKLSPEEVASLEEPYIPHPVLGFS
ncbi:MAG TPA: aldo/keto reductase [Acidobacteriaceae bacterium]|jgi:aryl-alcohol dehydrogenase-like predicted oxidoreductase|nr:aldo/keto reductase [Acidobacteriaceae bacterium]